MLAVQTGFNFLVFCNKLSRERLFISLVLPNSPQKALSVNTPRGCTHGSVCRGWTVGVYNILQPQGKSKYLPKGCISCHQGTWISPDLTSRHSCSNGTQILCTFAKTFHLLIEVKKSIYLSLERKPFFPCVIPTYSFLSTPSVMTQTWECHWGRGRRHCSKNTC